MGSFEEARRRATQRLAEKQAQTISDRNAEIRVLQQTNEALRKDVKPLEATVAKLEAELAKAKMRGDGVVEVLRTRDEQLRETRAENQALRLENMRLTPKIDNLSEALAEAQDTIREANTTIEDLKKARAAAEEEIAELITRNDNQRGTIEELGRQLKNVTDSVNKWGSPLVEAVEQLVWALDELPTLANQVYDLSPRFRKWVQDTSVERKTAQAFKKLSATEIELIRKHFLGN